MQNISFKNEASINSFGVEIQKLYKQVQAQDARLSELWNQCFDKNYQLINDQPFPAISEVTQDLKKTTAELKYLITALTKSSDNTISELANNILFDEIPYLEDRCFANVMQLDEMRPDRSKREVYESSKGKGNKVERQPLSIKPDDLRKELNKLGKAPRNQRRMGNDIMRFHQLLQTQFNVKNVAGDGRCGLRAIVRGIHPKRFEQPNPELERQLADELRREMVKLMAEQREDFEEFCKSDPLQRDKDLASFDEYLEKIGRSTTFIDEQELQALSRVILRPIWVYNMGAVHVIDNQIVPNENYRYGDEDFLAEPLCLIRSGVHFDLLESKKQEP